MWDREYKKTRGLGVKEDTVILPVISTVDSTFHGLVFAWNAFLHHGCMCDTMCQTWVKYSMSNNMNWFTTVYIQETRMQPKKKTSRIYSIFIYNCKIDGEPQV